MSKITWDDLFGSITPGIIQSGVVTPPENLAELERDLFAALERPCPPPLDKAGEK